MKIGTITCKALVDSGNLFRNVISKQFLFTLGLTLADLVPLDGPSSVGTAKEGAGLKILGRLKRPIHLSLAGVDTKFKTRPVVLDGLSMAFNLSGPFLKKHNIDQIHSTNSLRVQGREVPLVANLIPQEVEKTEALAYVANTVIVPPMATTAIPLTLPDVQKGEMPAGDGFLTGSIEFMGKTDTHPWLNAMVNCDRKGTIMAAVMNTLPEPISIKKGMQYGSFRLAVEPGEEKDYPWRVTAIKPKKATTAEKAPTKAEIDEIVEVFKLKESACLADQADLAKAAALLWRHRESFSFDGSFGKTNLIKHRIQTEPGKGPINQRYRPLNPVLETDLYEQVQTWLKHGVIEKSKSPWNFGLVAAPKKNGKIRWCVDFRALNNITIKDTHPIGNIDDNLVRLARSKIFSCIDGSGAYHVVEVSKEDRVKTAFATPWGSYQFTHMPFGLCNAPSTYARLVQMVLAGIPYSMALPYLDDTIVHSRDLPSHFTALEKVLTANAQAGLKLSPAKCSFFKEQVEYLGHLVTAEGIQPLKAYTKVVREWPVPTTRTQVRAFLGKVGYYRRFIKDYSKIASPLTDMLAQDGTKDKEQFEPTRELKDSFSKLKGALLKAPILAYPQFDSDQPFILDTDWSADNNAVGAVLSQVQGGLERVICYGGKRLSKSQASYSSTKGELCGAIIFMTRWKYFLQHRPFVLRIDNKALQWVHTLAEPVGMVQRWLDMLANFQFKVEHRPGTTHGNADGLSRAGHLDPADSEVDISSGERIAALEVPAWSTSNLCEEQDTDPDISEIKRLVRQGQAPSKGLVASLSRLGKIYAGLFSSLMVDEKGLLRYGQKRGAHDRKPVVLPRNLWTEAVRTTHEAGAHLAAQNTVERATPLFYFPGMLAYATKVIQACVACQTETKNSKDQRHTLVSSQSGYPFQKLSLDFVGPLPPSKKGNTFLLTIQDTFTRWLEAFPLRAATAANVVATLNKEIFARYGLCEQIHSDRGTQFTGDLLSDVASTLSIKHTHTPAYNPKSNPVERAHRTLGAALTALVEGQPNRWEEVLPQALFAMRTTPCRSTGFAPYRLMFGRDPTTNLDLIFGAPPPSPSLLIADYANELRNTIERAHHWARQNMSKTIIRQRRAYCAEHKSFTTGQKVWLFTPQLKPRQSRKFATFWTGPWTISKKLNDLMFEIKPNSAWVRKGVETVSIDRLKLFYDGDIPADQQCPPPADGNLAMPGDEHAEFITTEDCEPPLNDPLLFFPVPAPHVMPELPPPNPPQPIQPPPVPPAPPHQPPPQLPPEPLAQPPAEAGADANTPPNVASDPDSDEFQDALTKTPRRLRPTEREQIRLAEERERLDRRREGQADERAQRALRREHHGTD